MHMKKTYCVVLCFTVGSYLCGYYFSKCSKFSDSSQYRDIENRKAAATTSENGKQLTHLMDLYWTITSLYGITLYTSLYTRVHSSYLLYDIEQIYIIC